MNAVGLPPVDLAGLLHGRRMIVTGAAGGIGAAIVRSCAQAGASVVGLDVIPGDGITPCDVTDEAAVRRAFDEAAAGGRLDDVVHAAGVVAIGSVEETSVADFRKLIDVNLVGSFIVAREAAKRLGGGGNLVFIASQAGLKGGALWGAYSASKGGLLRLADCLVEELGTRGVRVNSISPGTVDTDMISVATAALAERTGTPAESLRRNYAAAVPLGRLAEPEEIGRAVVAVCSGLLSYMNGANLVLDGGELSR